MDWEDIIDLFKVGCVVFAIVAILTMISLAICIPVDIQSCNELRNQTGNETQWRIWNGCYVKVNGQFIPSEQWINNSGK